MESHIQKVLLQILEKLQIFIEELWENECLPEKACEKLAEDSLFLELGINPKDIQVLAEQVNKFLSK